MNEGWGEGKGGREGIETRAAVAGARQAPHDDNTVIFSGWAARKGPRPQSGASRSAFVLDGGLGGGHGPRYLRPAAQPMTDQNCALPLMAASRLCGAASTHSDCAPYR